MKPQKEPRRLNFGHWMSIVVSTAIFGVFLANIISPIQSEKPKIICESGSFIEKMKDDYPQIEIVVKEPEITKGEVVPSSPTTSEIVNINTANVEELCTLNGIGEVKANAIIAYRDENGGFDSIEEILRVKGIGDATFEKIRDSITV